MDSTTPLETQIGITFRDRALLSRALTHRSYLNENSDTVLQDNERLEFLGDAVLDFVVGAYLYHRYPEMNEGELTALRAALVRAETLAAFAKALRVGPFLRLGYGEDESGGRERVPLLCAAFEAVIGAIYLDQGLPAVQTLMDGLIAPALEEILASASHIDAKSEFQVWAQGRYNITPRYRVVDASGPDHAKTFTIQVLIDTDVWGQGRGRSKQLAAQAAAQQALLRAAETDDEADLA